MVRHIEIEMKKAILPNGKFLYTAVYNNDVIVSRISEREYFAGLVVKLHAGYTLEQWIANRPRTKKGIIVPSSFTSCYGRPDLFVKALGNDETYRDVFRDNLKYKYVDIVPVFAIRKV